MIGIYEKTMEHETIKKYIILSLLPGFGVISQVRLLGICEGIEGCYLLSFDELMRRDLSVDAGSRLGARRIETLCNMRFSRDFIEKAKLIIDNCAKKNIYVITREDDRYPDRFKTIIDMPATLYIKGDLSINERKQSVGVVGARRCSRKGKNDAISITEREVESGSAIISGMAKGIDSYAHTAALNNRGYTIAVLGNGPDICYPGEHMKLYAEIERHGCILSEYPPGTEPKAYSFPRRNRLIAALSDLVYVIDVGRNSGTASTVSYCGKYKRPVRMIDPKME